MKLRIALVAAAAMALPALLQAQTFEGEIRQRQIFVSLDALYPILEAEEGANAMEISTAIFDIPLEDILALADDADEGAVEVTELTFYVGTDRMRIDTEAAMMPGYMVMDFESGALRMVMPAQRMYLEITGEDLQQLQEQYADEMEGEEEVDAEVRPLGQTHVINGMSCEAYEIRQETTISRTCVSAELRDVVTAFAGFMERMKAFGMDEEENEDLEVFVLMQEHGFPVIEQTLYDYGWEQQYEISEVVSVQRGPVSEDKFSIPADYQRRSFMEMLGGEGN